MLAAGLLVFPDRAVIGATGGTTLFFLRLTMLYALGVVINRWSEATKGMPNPC